MDSLLKYNPSFHTVTDDGIGDICVIDVAKTDNLEIIKYITLIQAQWPQLKEIKGNALLIAAFGKTILKLYEAKKDKP